MDAKWILKIEIGLYPSFLCIFYSFGNPNFPDPPYGTFVPKIKFWHDLPFQKSDIRLISIEPEEYPILWKGYGGNEDTVLIFQEKGSPKVHLCRWGQKGSHLPVEVVAFEPKNQKVWVYDPDEKVSHMLRLNQPSARSQQKINLRVNGVACSFGQRGETKEMGDRTLTLLDFEPTGFMAVVLEGHVPSEMEGRAASVRVLLKDAVP
ncbi:MAG: hypothetical protein LBR62_02245 [Puniceicoccales bacterium]|jgi:hypothetical protein|nr:hypothetical protein [Puniceicoccales bacterium]